MTAWTKSKMGTRFSDHDDRMKEGSNTRWKERCSGMMNVVVAQSTSGSVCTIKNSV
jgi:hypothetical protein